MIVTDFDGREYKWPPTGHVPTLDQTQNKSSNHLRARELLKRIFGSYRIMEEVPLPGTKLRLDFYIHPLCIGVEVHGEQHYSYSPFFHGSTANFLQSRRNDRLKREWCDMNDITLIELPHNEDEEEWTHRLQS